MDERLAASGRADEHQVSAELLVERMHDRQATVVGFVGLPGGVLVVAAGIIHWLVDPRRGSGWFAVTATVGLIGLASIIVAALVAAQAEYRIARAEHLSRLRSAGRGLRVAFGFAFHLLP